MKIANKLTDLVGHTPLMRLKCCLAGTSSAPSPPHPVSVADNERTMPASNRYAGFINCNQLMPWTKQRYEKTHSSAKKCNYTRKHVACLKSQKIKASLYCESWGNS